MKHPHDPETCPICRYNEKVRLLTIKDAKDFLEEGDEDGRTV
jgi:hypothetical protein